MKYWFDNIILFRLWNIEYWWRICLDNNFFFFFFGTCLEIITRIKKLKEKQYSPNYIYKIIGKNKNGEWLKNGWKRVKVCHTQFFTIIRWWIKLGTHSFSHLIKVSIYNWCVIKIVLVTDRCENVKCWIGYKIECVYRIARAKIYLNLLPLPPSSPF